MAQINVSTLPVASAEQAATALQNARSVSTTLGSLSPAGPGSIKERWPVKTCQDDDIANVVQTIVPSTVLDLGSLPRPDVWADSSTDPPAPLQTHRVQATETAIWKVPATVIALKMESDGDYHLVLQDSSGNMMVAEVPNPDAAYIQNYNPADNPYHDAIAAARAAVDNQFGASIQATQFVAFTSAFSGETKLVARSAIGPGAISGTDASSLNLSAMTADPDTMQPFTVQITPTPATVTGIGFFDKSHGATGAAPNVFELHPVINIVFGS